MKMKGEITMLDSQFTGFSDNKNDSARSAHAYPEVKKVLDNKSYLPHLTFKPNKKIYFNGQLVEKFQLNKDVASEIAKQLPNEGKGNLEGKEVIIPADGAVYHGSTKTLEVDNYTVVKDGED